MPSISVIKTLLRELTTMERSPRVNEPDLVMDDPEKVAAYTRAGREDDVMAPVYLYHCAQICEIIRPGETVVDLACGPATQLAMVARLNPETHFIGVELSPEMLKKAKAYIDEQYLCNIELREGSITDLSFFENNSIDAVTSTVALHHLPDLRALDRTFSEINRILKADGGLYLVDFGHLKSEKSIKNFAYQYADRQAELFTLDYLYSLRAAFTLQNFKELTQKHLKFAEVYSTFLMPYMVVVKSQQRRRAESAQQIIKSLHSIHKNLPSCHKTDITNLITFFRLGGLQSHFLKSVKKIV